MKLTQTVKKGGCAAKVPAVLLREILSGVKFPPKIPGVRIDGSEFDDAAIFEIDEKRSLVQTLDFFTPIVNDPKDFGAVAAANALSDVYAMGGRPKTCMAILAAPLAVLEPAIIQEVLQGACDVIEASGSSLVGGHSIDDDTLKFGLSVTGLVETAFVWSNATAKAGDHLILTKPLGTGTICAGVKKEELSDEAAKEAIDSMKRLNNIIDFIPNELLSKIHGATDVTGFGLLGHSYQMAKASNISLQFKVNDVPIFTEAKSGFKKGWLTKAHRSNSEYVNDHVNFGDLNEEEKFLFFDPQTSGGLLLSVDPESSEDLLKCISPHFPGAAIIGRTEEKGATHVTLAR
jgi:selenide, water dikinase